TADEAAQLRSLQHGFRSFAPGSARLGLMSVFQKLRQVLFDVFFRMSALRAQPHEAGVDHDAMQPRGDLRRLLERTDGPEGGDERVLQSVSRILFGMHKAPRDAKQ